MAGWRLTIFYMIGSTSSIFWCFIVVLGCRGVYIVYYKLKLGGDFMFFVWIVYLKTREYSIQFGRHIIVQIKSAKNIFND